MHCRKERRWWNMFCTDNRNVSPNKIPIYKGGRRRQLFKSFTIGFVDERKSWAVGTFSFLLHFLPTLFLTTGYSINPYPIHPPPVTQSMFL
jgi:hypothetical protein